MSIVSDECIYFWSCLHLWREYAQCVRLRWRQDPLFIFCFEDFKLRIKNETQDIAINHNLWSFFFVFFCGRTDFIFFQLKEKWSMAFNIFFLSYTWQSVGFWFHVIHYGCFFFCPCVLGFSLNDCTPGELNFNPLCVSVDTGRLLWPACTERRLLYLFKLARPGCCHAAAIRRKTHHTAKHAHNRHTAERSCDNCYISCLKPLLPSPFFFHDVRVFRVF